MMGCMLHQASRPDASRQDYVTYFNTEQAHTHKANSKTHYTTADRSHCRDMSACTLKCDLAIHAAAAAGKIPKHTPAFYVCPAEYGCRAHRTISCFAAAQCKSLWLHALISQAVTLRQTERQEVRAQIRLLLSSTTGGASTMPALSA